MSNETQRKSSQFSVRQVVIALFAAVLLSSLVAKAQQETAKSVVANDAKPAVTAAQNPAPKLFTAAANDRYRIGPGDILDIRILNRPNLSRENVRVEGDGTIRMPLIEGSIQAACLNETELSQQVRDRYLKYYRNPQVDVFIKEYRSTQVAIVGQVNDQSRFMLQRRIRLLELLTYAKGTSKTAGRTINVIHSDTAFRCTQGELTTDGVPTGLSSYKLSDTLNGEEKANPYLENGDIVNVPEAEQVFVTGNVITPRMIPLKDEPITLTMAIAAANGLNKDTKTDKIRIVRQEGSTKKELYYDLAAIEKKQAADPVLVANDIVDVPISGTKSLLRSLVGGIGPAVSQMPVRVIP
jgi:polysaccharide export outer membrane protein